jgi:hypothetical protein
MILKKSGIGQTRFSPGRVKKTSAKLGKSQSDIF